MTLGEPKWKSFDWMGTHQTMFSVIHESIEQKKIPYHVKCYDMPIIGDPIEEGTSGSYNVRWFALGGNIVSPQNLIFGFFDTPKIMLLNLLFYFTISLFGMVLWMKKLNLSHFSSVFLFICWSFSGFITSRMGVGHLGSTNGYFFIPLYFWIINQFLIENYRDKTNLEMLKDAIIFSIFIFFVKLNNNGQNVYQFLLIGLIVSIFYYKNFLWYLVSLVLSFCLLSFYIFPTIFFSTYMEEQRIIMGGYGFNMGHYNTLLFSIEYASSLIKLGVYHFINIIYQILCSIVFPYTAAMDGAYEHSLYIGKFGFILILFCAFSYFRRISFNKVIKQPIFIICLIVFVLSLSIVEQQIFIFLDNVFNIKIPVVDRLPSRLMIYPFCVILIIASLGFDDLFERIPKRFSNICKYAMIIILFLYLMEHSYGWSVAKTESNYLRPIDEIRHLFSSESTVILDISRDINYIKVVNYSYTVSVVAFFLFFFCFLYLKRIDKKIFSLN